MYIWFSEIIHHHLGHTPKISEKPKFLTLWYAYKQVRIRVLEMFIFFFHILQFFQWPFPNNVFLHIDDCLIHFLQKTLADVTKTFRKPLKQELLTTFPIPTITTDANDTKFPVSWLFNSLFYILDGTLNQLHPLILWRWQKFRAMEL